MRRRAKVALILLLLATGSSAAPEEKVKPGFLPSDAFDQVAAHKAAPPEEKQAVRGVSLEHVATGYRKFMPGTKIALKPRKAKYFLGENILLDYQISYDGDGALEIDSVDGIGTYACTVIATDREGKQAPAPALEFNCHGQSGRPLRRGDSITLSIPLIYYCRLEQPGTYCIRASYNLYWSELGSAIPQDDPRWAEATIEVGMPDAGQAKQVVEHMRRLEKDVDYYRDGTWETPDYANFACLQYPVYLSILEQLANDKEGDKRALLGITHNPTPEATEALLRLLKDVDKDRVKQITASLCDRLPDPQGVNRPNRRNPIRFADAESKLVKRSWRGDFAFPVRRFARTMLNDDDPTTVRCAAYILEAVGTREDMPALLAAVSRLVPIVEKTKPPEYIGEIAPIREACRDATFAIEALAASEVEPTTDPQTAGEIIHFLLMVKQQKDFRPISWEKHCANWVRNESPYVREFVLFNTPRPLPGSLLEPYRESLRKVIATTREQTTIHVAVRCALELKIQVDEILGMLVEKLDADEPQLYFHLFNCFGDLLKTGRHDRVFMSCTQVPNKKQMASLKDAWKRFLQDQGQAIRNGKHFNLDSPEVRPLMSPYHHDEGE